MKMTQTPTHQIAELGTVTNLTLGTGISGFENRYTPVGVSMNKPQTRHVIEVGKASNLTLGTVGPKYETPNRPNSTWGRYKNQ